MRVKELMSRPLQSEKPYSLANSIKKKSFQQHISKRHAAHSTLTDELRISLEDVTETLTLMIYDPDK